MKTRELTRLNNAGAIRSFDISPDGNIVFDRLRGNSHVVLIDLPAIPKSRKSDDWIIADDAGRKTLWLPGRVIDGLAGKDQHLKDCRYEAMIMPPEASSSRRPG